MDGLFWTGSKDVCQLLAVTSHRHVESGPRLCVCSHADVRPSKCLCNCKVSVVCCFVIIVLAIIV